MADNERRDAFIRRYTSPDPYHDQYSAESPAPGFDPIWYKLKSSPEMTGNYFDFNNRLVDWVNSGQSGEVPDPSSWGGKPEMIRAILEALMGPDRRHPDYMNYKMALDEQRDAANPPPESLLSGGEYRRFMGE